MKKLSLILLFFCFAFIIMSPSCKTGSVSTSFLVPADISIPQHVQSVGLLNRSLPEKKNQFLNILEGFLTGESILADRESSINAIRAAVATLNANPRFKAVSLEGEDYRGTGTKEFPSPLDWAIIDELCKKYKVDALVVLETYDSDVMLSRDRREKKTRKDGKDIIVIEHVANLSIRSNAGWRFYDNVEKRIIDKQVFTDEKGFSAVGLSAEEALRKLPSKRAALNESGIFSGEMLAFRISPKWLNAGRYYFVKGPKEETFKNAKPYVKTKKWDEAAALWLPLTTSPHKKIAGRACYNMALAEEMQGNIAEAIEWAQKAYIDHGLKQGRTYVKVLKKRQMEQVQLIEQMEGK